jgi:large subunit ribosomal protein L6
MSLGYSHPVVFDPVEGIKLQTPDEVTIKVEGADKGLVSQTAAKIKSLRPPEPYKGKGIRYENEIIIKKAGKAGKAGVGAYGPPGGKA